MKRKTQRPFAVWITGLPASGKSTLAAELAQQMRELGIDLTVLESDALRKLFSTSSSGVGEPAGSKKAAKRRTAAIRHERLRMQARQGAAIKRTVGPTLRYDEQDREYFYGALAFIGHVLTEHGIVVIFDATANRRSYRDRARNQIPLFAEVFVDCPLDVCIRRDPKGIYRKAREGQASQVPGVQTVYEPPEHPDIVVRGDRDDPKDAARRIIDLLMDKNFLGRSNRHRSGTRKRKAA